jgi:hypothetical protein
MKLIRYLLGLAFVPVLLCTGTRFSRKHRNNEDMLYFLVDTVYSNYIADKFIKGVKNV